MRDMRATLYNYRGGSAAATLHRKEKLLAARFGVGKNNATEENRINEKRE